MKFAIAPVTYWDSIGFDTTEWRKSLDGTKAICHLEYAEKLGANLHANPQVQIIDSVDPNLKNILESSEWVIDGTNGDLDSFSFLTKLNQFETKVNDAVSQKTADLTTQLQQKIGGSIKAEPENLSATTLGLITGNGGPINLLSIPQDGSVDSKKLSSKLTKPSYNILDESTIDDTGYYHFGDGVRRTGQGTTPLIPVKPNEEFTTFDLGGHVTFWEADGTTFINGFDGGLKFIIKVPDDPRIKFMRVMVQKPFIGGNRMMLLKGTYELDHLPYYKYGEMMPNFTQSGLVLDEVKSHHIANGQITDTKFASHLTKPSYNILDESTVEKGNYYNWATGNNMPGQGTTPLIPVKPNEVFTVIEIGSQVTFWEADGTTYVGGADTGGTTYHLKVPYDTKIKFMRILTPPLVLGTNKAMLLKGRYDLDDTPYYKYDALMLSIPNHKSSSESQVFVEEMEPKLTKPSYNILDESTIDDTGYYHFSDGVKRTGFGTTPLIPVKAREVFTCSKTGGNVTYWKADGVTFVTGYNSNTNENYRFKVPELEDIAFARISILNGRVGKDEIMVLRGHYELDNLPYYRYGELMPNNMSEFNKLSDDFRVDLVKDITEAYEGDLNFIKPFKRVKNPILTRDIVTDRNNPTGVADPFIVMDKGRYHMFFEVLGGEHPVTGAKFDEIGHAYSDNLIDWTYTEIVLGAVDVGHRSAYPHVFKIDGEWYMLPDSRINVPLYKASNFPLEWEFQTNLLIGNFGDTNVFKMGDTWYLTTLNLDDRGLSLYINTSGDWKNSNWTLHPVGIIIPDTTELGGHRMAGNHMIVDDCVYLPVQETPEGTPYGYSTRLYKLVNLSPTTVEAVDMGLLAIAQHNGDWNGTSMHHVAYAKYLDRKIFALDGTGPLGYSIGLYVENYI